MNKADEYSQKVLSGEILACKFIKQACERYEYDKTRKDIYWDQESVDRFMFFAENIVYIPELRRKNEVPLPYAFWIQQLYGWKYTQTGRRRFRDVYVQVARKNFKTFYAGIISLYELLFEGDTYPEILHGANSREQALICTGKTGEIIKKSPQLNELWEGNKGDLRMFTHKEETLRIFYEDDERRGSITAMPKNPGDGGNPSVGIVDEFHEAKDILLLETIKSGQGQRLNPLTLVITSPGLDKSVPCFTMLRETGIKTLSDYKSDSYDQNLAIIYELDNENEWDKPELMDKSNPMIPYSPTLRGFVSERINEAKQYGGAKASHIKIKNCGLWIDQASIWIPTETINANNFDVSGIDLSGAICYAGLDLSAGGDLNAFAMLFPNVLHPDGKERHLVKMMFWIPSDKMEITNKEVMDYRRMKELGYVRVFDGNIVEYDVIAQDIMDELSNYDVRVLACDRAYLANGPAPFFKGTDYENLIEPISQGFGLSGAITEVENWMNEEKMNLLNNPVLKWNFSNVTVKTGTKGDIRIDKEDRNKKIDGVDALLDAVDYFMKNPPEDNLIWSAVV